MDETRLITLAVHRDRGHAVRQLQRCDCEISLADTDADGIARIPDLLFLVLERLTFPCRRWNERRLFAVDIDTGLGAKAELREEVVDAIDAEHIGEAVEVDVAG